MSNLTAAEYFMAIHGLTPNLSRISIIKFAEDFYKEKKKQELTMPAENNYEEKRIALSHNAISDIP